MSRRLLDGVVKVVNDDAASDDDGAAAIDVATAGAVTAAEFAVVATGVAAAYAPAARDFDGVGAGEVDVADDAGGGVVDGVVMHASGQAACRAAVVCGRHKIVTTVWTRPKRASSRPHR